MVKKKGNTEGSAKNKNWIIYLRLRTKSKEINPINVGKTTTEAINGINLNSPACLAFMAFSASSCFVMSTAAIPDAFKVFSCKSKTALNHVGLM